MLAYSTYLCRFGACLWLIVCIAGCAQAHPSSDQGKSILDSNSIAWTHPENLRACFSHLNLNPQEQQDSQTLQWAEGIVRTIVAREINTHTRVNLSIHERPCRELDLHRDIDITISWNNQELSSSANGPDTRGYGNIDIAYDFERIIGLDNNNPSSPAGSAWLKTHCQRSTIAQSTCIELVTLHELGHLLFLARDEHLRDENECPGFHLRRNYIAKSIRSIEDINVLEPAPPGSEYVLHFEGEPFDAISIMNPCYYHRIVASDRILDADFHFQLSPGDIRTANGVYPSMEGYACGNGYCEPGENQQNCPQDCGR